VPTCLPACPHTLSPTARPPAHQPLTQSAMSKVVVTTALINRQPLYLDLPELKRRLLSGTDELAGFTAILDRIDPGCTMVEGGSAHFRTWIGYSGEGSIK